MLEQLQADALRPRRLLRLAPPRRRVRGHRRRPALDPRARGPPRRHRGGGGRRRPRGGGRARAAVLARPPRRRRLTPVASRGRGDPRRPGGDRLARRRRGRVHPAPVRRPLHVPGRRLPRALQRRPPRSARDRRARVGGVRPGGNRLVLDGETLTGGAVGVLLDGDVEVRTLVSQGCRPIGRPFMVTKADRNFVEELGGQARARAAAGDGGGRDRGGAGAPAHAACTSASSSTSTRRSSAGATSSSATCSAPTSAPVRMAVGDAVEVGQTVQFQVRDADAADEDLRELLAGADADGRAAVHLQRPRAAPVRRFPTTTPAWSSGCSGRSHSRARSAPARSGPSAGATSSTASPPASPSSREVGPHLRLGTRASRPPTYPARRVTAGRTAGRSAGWRGVIA